MDPRARRRLLATATACAFVNFVAFLGLTPLYPDVARDLGLGVDSLGLYFAISSVVGAVMQIPVGVVADRFGRRSLLLAGLLVLALSLVLRWLSNTPLIFGASLFVIGATSALVVASAYGLVAEAFTYSGRGQAMGVLQVGINLGQVAGFLAAGLAGPVLGWRGFSLAIAALPVLLLPLVARLPEPPLQPVTGTLLRTSGAALRYLVRPEPAALAGTATISLGAAFAANYLLPFIARGHGVTEGATSALLVPYIAGSVAGAPLIGSWSDRAGHRRPLLVAIGLSAAALAAFALAGFSTVSVIVCYAVLGAGMSSVTALVATRVSDNANRSGTGTGAALGGLRLAQQAGPALGPALAGFAYLHAGQAAAYLTLTGLLAAAAACALVATAPRPPAPGPAPT